MKSISAARQRAESLRAMETRESSFKRQQERQREAMAAKTAYLRELRLAKEAAERQAEAPKPVRQQRRKPRRIKCY
jgi:hypothetical protein